MATHPFPPCGYSREEVLASNNYDRGTMSCTILCDGIPCGRELKDHPFQPQLIAQLTPEHQGK